MESCLLPVVLADCVRRICRLGLPEETPEPAVCCFFGLPAGLTPGECLLPGEEEEDCLGACRLFGGDFAAVACALCGRWWCDCCETPVSAECLRNSGE